MKTTFINNTDLMSSDWRFIEPYWTDSRVDWKFFHGVPQNGLERRVRKPNLARYRAAFQSARAAASQKKGEPVLVSHLPGLSAATNICRRIMCPSVRQIAFAFNFTDIPTGRRLAYFQKALSGISEYVVFSEMERKTYSEVFDIPLEKFRMLHWAMSAPILAPKNIVDLEVPYFCAIGGEGRDYALLADVMRSLPEVRMVIVARPYSIVGIDFPENVRVLTNLPGPVTWRLAKESQGLVIPLKSATTACGHITIVGAQLLNIPMIATKSIGVADYISSETALLVAPGDRSDLRAALEEISIEKDAVDNRQRAAFKLAEERSALSTWVDYFENTVGHQ